MKILFLANNDSGLYKFRRELLETLVQEHEVSFCVPPGEYVSAIQALGCRYIPCDLLDRHGTNPLKELKLLGFYRRILRQLRPDVVFTYTIKPNVYGGLACAGLRIPYIANVTGLGVSLENKGVLQTVTKTLYRFGLWKARRVFFQNKSNREFMIKNRIVTRNWCDLPGSGVNLEQHRFEAYPAETDSPVFTTIGRIMKDKGIDELLQAARAIKKEYPQVIFRLIGSFEENYQEIIRAAAREGILEYIEPQNDIHPFMKESHAILHPSYHEGMSNVCLEGAATGRPILASDIPGCRETFEEGVSGIGFRPRDPLSLEAAIRRFLALPYEARKAMGAAGRKKVEAEFDRKLVIRAYLDAIADLNTRR